MQQLKQRQRGGFDGGMTDAFCVLAIDSGLSPDEIQVMRLPRFFVLLDFIVDRKDREKRELEKAKRKGKRR